MSLTPSKRTVLIVDDSVIVRKLVSEAVSSVDDIEAVTASNGKIALDKLDRIKPDFVVLDVEMPVMDGIATLREIRARDKKLPVLMFSTLTTRGAAIAMDALSIGANDCMAKPSGLARTNDDGPDWRQDLLQRIDAFCPSRAKLTRSAVRPVVGGLQSQPVAAAPRPANAGTMPVDIVAIGSSTGGPVALKEVITALPADFPVPIVITQHMPKVFTAYLAESLNSKSALNVRECIDGSKLEPGDVWIAQGGLHMLVEGSATESRVVLDDAPPEQSCRPAVDPMFRSVAEIYGPRMLSVVLTGMGQDGASGAEFVRNAGGHVIAQDEATSVVWGMPGTVTRNGLADQVLPLNEIAGAIVQQVSRKRRPLAVRSPV